MRKRIISAFILIAISSSLYGCGGSVEDTENSRSINSFVLGNSAISHQAIWGGKGDKGDNSNVVDGDGSIGEVILKGEDSSKKYEISGEDIIYNNVKFLGLGSALDKIETPYSKETFINFIVKTYKASSNTVSVLVNIDSGVSGPLEDGVGAEVTIDESLRGESEDYIRVSEQYNSKAVWSLMLYIGDYDNVAILSGCKEFMVYKGTSGALEVDMSKYMKEGN